MAPRSAPRRLDQVDGPLLHLVVDAAQVLAEDADPDKLDAAEEGDERDERRDPGRRGLHAQQALDDEVEAEREAEGADHHPGVRQDPKGKVGEAEETVHGVPEEPPEGLLRFPAARSWRS